MEKVDLSFSRVRVFSLCLEALPTVCVSSGLRSKFLALNCVNVFTVLLEEQLKYVVHERD